jgi:DNA replication protein DnaC
MECSIPSVAFYEWRDIGMTERMDERSFLTWLETADAESLLVLDDIGTETDRFKSGDATCRLCDLLNRRENKFTVLTTNIPPADWLAHWDARVSDRLLRNSAVVLIRAPSFATQ